VSISAASGKIRIILLATAIAGVCTLYLAYKAPPKASPSLASSEKVHTVVTAVVQRRDVAIAVDGLGTIQAFNRVVVKPRVGGQIVDIAFTEGQSVEAGAVLAHIDPKPFAAALKQARSTKEKDEAQLTNTRRDLKRTSDLAQKGFSADQALDTQRATVASQEANVDADEAAIEAAQIQLDYTVVRSPIAGVTGIRMVDAGNIIQPNDPGIVSVAQLEPVSLVFTLPASSIQSLSVGRQDHDIRVEILSPDRSAAIETGFLALVDNAIDPATSMVKLKAVFPNKDHALKPGQFVNARLCLSTRQNAVTLPPTAIQQDQEGTFVYLVDPSSHVKRQAVTLEPASVKGALIVKAGLEGGETVVSDGQYGLSEHSLVAASKTASSGPIASSSIMGLP